MSTVNQLLADAGLKPTLASDHQLRSRVLRIGPKEAAALLVANRDNRKIRPGRVKYYARVMKQGGWRLTHQGIAFCIDGRGLDLQHRLTAIIESGVTVDIVVTEGLSPEAFDAIDQHERRSAADALQMDRYLVQVAKFAITVRGGEGATTPTVLELGEVCAALHDSHAQVIQACGSRRETYTSAALRLATIVLMHERQSPQVLKNYRAMALAHSEDWSRAMHAFHRQIANGKADSTGYNGRLELLARALVAFDPTRAELSKIQIDSDTIKASRRRVAMMLSTLTGDMQEEA